MGPGDDKGLLLGSMGDVREGGLWGPTVPGDVTLRLPGLGWPVMG